MILRNLLLIIIINVILLSSCNKEQVIDPDLNTNDTSSIDNTVEYTFLHSSGKRIVNAEDQNVILNGVNLGCWLLQEPYLLGSQNTEIAQFDVKKQLFNEGKTPNEIDIFYSEWREQFITKSDVDYIKTLGFNCIRLPLHYELFLSKEQQEVRNEVIWDQKKYDFYLAELQSWYKADSLFSIESEGFRMIDKVIGWAKENEMWIILDLHAAPGGQNNVASITDAFYPLDFWIKPFLQDVTRLLWDRISEKYNQESTIAMYELLNEPNASENTWVRDFYNKVITEIRNNGDDHIILIDGNQFGNNYWEMTPDKFIRNENLVYTSHRYLAVGDNSENLLNDSESDPYRIRKLANLVNFRNNYNVPVWVGETGENTNEVMEGNIYALKEIGVGYCHWTYKRFNHESWASLRMINPPYLISGTQFMDTVLQNIKFENTYENISTVNSVKP